MNTALDTPESDLSALDSDTIVAVPESEGHLFAPPQLGDHPSGTRQTATVSDAPVRFKIRLANTEGRRSSASYLVEKMYGWRGYNTSSMPMTPDRVTLVASNATRAIATLSVGFDSPKDGLLVESVYAEEVANLRSRGGRLCEFTKLAVERSTSSTEVLAMLFHIGYMYAYRMHGCTTAVVEVNPRHVRFYERMLGFSACGPTRVCPRVGAPAVLLQLDLAWGETQIEKFGGHRELAGQVRSLYPYFFSPYEEENIVKRLKAIG